MKKEMLINKIANRLGYNTAYCSEAVRDGMRADVVDFCIEYQDDLPRLDQPKIDKLIEWAQKRKTDCIQKCGSADFIMVMDSVIDKAKEIRDEPPKEEE